MTCLSIFDDIQILTTRSCKSSLPEFRLIFCIIKHFTQLRACDQVTVAEDNRDPGPQPPDDARPDLRETEAGHPAHGGVLWHFRVPRRLDCHRDTYQAYSDILCEVTWEYALFDSHWFIFSLRLQIQPRLSGLISAIYHHPWAAAFVGIISLLSMNLFFIFAVKLNLASKFLRGQMSSNIQTDENWINTRPIYHSSYNIYYVHVSISIRWMRVS